MNILFIGSTWSGSTSLQRMKALQDIGHKVTEVSTHRQAKGHKLTELYQKVLHKLGLSPHIMQINRMIRQALLQEQWDLIWLDKAVVVKAATLQQSRKLQPSCKIVFYSPDDMMLSSNLPRHCLPLYDLYVTTKSYNVAELKAMGSEEVLFIDNAYDPFTHRPLTLTTEEKKRWSADVFFVGGFERERLQEMLKVADAGVVVTARGPGWEPAINTHPNLIIDPGWVLNDDYAKSIYAAKINLCFLRKIARDKQTTRSIEIPACGGFMLAERTDEHLRLFEEGKEAAFFASTDELIEKTKYYLAHDAEREAIAKAGRERCLSSGYSNQERIAGVLQHLEHIPIKR